MHITDLLAFAVQNKASDLHISTGLPPMIRVHGEMRRINRRYFRYDYRHYERLATQGISTQLGNRLFV